jgi:hypothetical protein
MKRKVTYIIITVAAVSVAVIYIASFIGNFTAERLDCGGILFRGNIYRHVSTTHENRYGRDRSLGVSIANWHDSILNNLFFTVGIGAIRHDPELDFITAGWGLFSKTVSEVRPGKEITAIYLGYDLRYRLQDPKDIALMLSLRAIKGERYSYPGTSSLRFSEYISIGYDNSPVSARNMGTLAKIHDTWIYVPEGSYETIKNDDGTETYMVHGITIVNEDITRELTRIINENNMVALIQADPNRGPRGR